MVLNDQRDEPSQQMVTFFFGEIIDFRNVNANSEDALPPGYWVRTNNRVNGL